MERLLLLVFTCIFHFSIVKAQLFDKSSYDLPFEGVETGSTRFADVDNDGDQDVLITGLNDSNVAIAKLYTNNGEGQFFESTDNSFKGVKFSTVAFYDIDNDRDIDLFIAGSTDAGSRVSTLYLNDGRGSFSEANNVFFEGVDLGSVALGDVDGDNDIDVFITGRSGTNAPITKLYKNDGEGNFIDTLDDTFEVVRGGSIALGDIDGDQDLDFILTGSGKAGRPTSKIYINNGIGIYMEEASPFIEVQLSSIDLKDIDGDNDLDVLISGSSANGRVAKLYFNDGDGNFVERMDTPFLGVNTGDVALVDIDNDNDSDVIITGLSNNGPIARLYINDEEIFREADRNLFEGVELSSVDFADVDNDNDLDILILGETEIGNRSANLYINNTITTSIEKLTNFDIFEVTIFPNLVSTNQLNININSSKNRFVRATLVNSNGYKIKVYDIEIAIGINTLATIIPYLNRGVYFFHIESDGEYRILKFMVF